MLNEIFYSLGKNDALKLRENAATMTDTEIIDEEIKIPNFKNIDYSKYPIGAPVKSLGQIYTLLQSYDATVHKQLPKDARDRWHLCHTKNPQKAVEWIAPLGTSGMYKKDECYKDKMNNIWRCIADETNFSAQEYPANWEKYCYNIIKQR